MSPVMTALMGTPRMVVEALPLAMLVHSITPFTGGWMVGWVMLTPTLKLTGVFAIVVSITKMTVSF